MSNSIIPTAVLQEVMDAMDDMASDSRLLDMAASRVHQFDAARDALRAALDNLQCGREQNPNMIPAGWKLVPVEPTRAMLYDIQEYSHILPPRGKRIWSHMLAAAPQPPTTEDCSAVEQPQSEQDPAAEHKLKDVRCECCGYMTHHREHMGCIRAAQPKQEPLTDEQITAATGTKPGTPMWPLAVAFARAIEAAHNIK